MCGTHPMVYLFGFPTPRPFGLPSHSDRLNGAGLTGHPSAIAPGMALPPTSLWSCPGRPEIDVLGNCSRHGSTSCIPAVVSISPLTVRFFGAARSPKQTNHQMRAERQHRCELAHRSRVVWGITLRDRNLSGTNYRAPRDGLSVSRRVIPRTAMHTIDVTTLLEFSTSQINY
jgi:hypothetical protein